MSIFGTGSSDFAPLSGEETIDLGQFNDIDVYGNIYLKEATDTYTGYNVPLITTNKSNDDMIFNTTTLSSNWDFTVGTGQDTKESIFRINPTTGLHFEANNTAVNIDWNELSYLNGARSNIQAQLDNLDPDLSSNQGYWGNFWNSNTITNPSANGINAVAFPTADANNYGFSVSNSSRIVAGHAGIYMFIATIQINKSQGSTDEDVFFWIRQNGVDVPDTAFKETIKAEPILATANWQLKMNAGDYFQLMWSSPDIHVQLVAYGAGTTPTKPAIPSVILTASQVSFLVAGGAGLLPLTYNSTTNNLLCDASFQVVGNTDLSGNTTKIRGNLDLLGRMTNNTTKEVICDVSFQVLGNTDLSGNTKQRGNIDISGVLTTTNNVFASGSTFSYTRNIENITVQNALWTDGSGATPTYNNLTYMFTDQKNKTITIQGWTWSGTAISTINGFNGVWTAGASDFNHYGGAPPSSGPYYAFFECYSPGTNQNNSTFYFQKELTLDAGFYVADWWSWWGAGTQYSTTSLSVSIGSGASLLTYNDSDTRSTLTWKARSLLFEVKTSGSNPLRWTYRDTQSTANRFFNASIGNLRIKKYNGLTVKDASNTSLVSGSLCQMNNLTMKGTNAISGTLSMVGIPSFYSTKGVNNICMSTSFTQATLASNAANNIAIGSIAFYAESFVDTVLIGQGSMSNAAQQQKVASKVVAIGNEVYGAGKNDVVIGYGCRKSYDVSYSDCVLIGTDIGRNDTSITPFNRCVGIGSQLWTGYYSGNATVPNDNVAVGYAAQGQDAIFGSYNTAIGSYSQSYLNGNLTTASYNTSIGYSSGIDPRANPLSANFRQRYYGATYVGAWTGSPGDVSGIVFPTALGYFARADASYCTVIGADASYNVMNTIRLGRPIDTTVASHLTVNGTTTLTGNTTVGNLSITGSVSGLSFTNLSLSGNLSVEGITTLGNNSSNSIQLKGNLINRGDGNSMNIESGNINMNSGLKLNIDCGTEGGVNYGVYDLVAYIKARDQVCYDRGTEGVNAASDAQSTADGAAAAAAAAGTVASGAAALGLSNASAITGLTGTLTALSGTVGTQGTAIVNLESSVSTLQAKTEYMYLVSYDINDGETTNFFNRIAVRTSVIQITPSVDLRATGVSYFNNGLQSKTISTTAGQTQNLLGSTINIGDNAGNTIVSGSFAATGNSVVIGNHANGFTNVYGSFAASGYTNVLGNTTAGSTTTIHGDGISIGTGTNATITLGNTSTTKTTILGDLSGNGANTTLGGTGAGSITQLNGNNISIGTGTNNVISIGNGLFTTTNIYGDLSGNGYNTTLGNTNSGSTTTLRGANISIGGLSSTIYINGLIYIPFNPASFVTALAQWT